MSDPTWEERMRPRPPAPFPRLDRLEVLWRLQATSGRTLECVLYRVETGRELRLQPEGKEDAAAMTQLLAPHDADREDLSERWRTTLIEKGFTEVA